MNGSKENRNLVKDYLVPALTVITTGLSLLLTFWVQSLSTKTDTAIKTLEQQRLERESEAGLRFKVYEAVKQALDAGTARQQEVSLALVNAVLPDSDLLRISLLKVLGESADSGVKEQANKALYNVEQQQVLGRKPEAGQSRPDRLKDWDFDLFWCEGSGESAHTMAEQVKALLTSRGYGQSEKSFVRVRMLPSSIRKTSGYANITGFEIRRNEGEEEEAEQLRRMVAEALGGNVAVRVGISKQVTQYYLSVFICPEASP